MQQILKALAAGQTQAELMQEYLELELEDFLFDVLAATFGLPRSKAGEHAHRIAKALERTLRTQGVLPARAIDALAQMH